MSFRLSFKSRRWGPDPVDIRLLSLFIARRCAALPGPACGCARRQRGMTLIELMVAMTLGMLVLGVVTNSAALRQCATSTRCRRFEKRQPAVESWRDGWRLFRRKFYRRCLCPDPCATARQRGGAGPSRPAHHSPDAEGDGLHQRPRRAPRWSAGVVRTAPPAWRWRLFCRPQCTPCVGVGLFQRPQNFTLHNRLRNHRRIRGGCATLVSTCNDATTVPTWREATAPR